VSGHAQGGIPPIVGLPTDAFVDALLAYKNGERDNQVMRSVTGSLGLEEIAALAAYFAKLSPD
jgi:cytochrome c